MADDIAPAASQSPAAEIAPASTPIAEAAPAASSQVEGAAVIADEGVAEAVVQNVEGTDGKVAPETAITEAAKTTDGFLADATSKEGAKPAEGTEAPKPEGADAINLPAFEAFTLPEGVTFEAERLGAFTKVLGEFEIAAKADHAAVQAFGQQLMDLYIAEGKTMAAKTQEAQQQAWNDTKATWLQQFREDPEIGGNRRDTTFRQCGALLERYGSMQGKQREADVRMALKVTGAEVHPEVIRFFNWASQFATERARPIPAIVPKAPVPTSRAVRRYGPNSSGG